MEKAPAFPSKRKRLFLLSFRAFLKHLCIDVSGIRAAAFGYVARDIHEFTLLLAGGACLGRGHQVYRVSALVAFPNSHRVTPLTWVKGNLLRSDTWVHFPIPGHISEHTVKINASIFIGSLETSMRCRGINLWRKWGEVGARGASCIMSDRGNGGQDAPYM
jgi:hypothetical protein